MFILSLLFGQLFFHLLSFYLDCLLVHTRGPYGVLYNTDCFKAALKW